MTTTTTGETDVNADPCECPECEAIHRDFISHFGRFPTMSHEDARALAARRESNEASWRRALDLTGEPR